MVQAANGFKVRNMTGRVVYSRHYNIGFYGLERLHPFDSRKYGRAWKHMRKRLGSALRSAHIRTDRAASRDELRLVHSESYLNRLRDPAYVAAALEVPAVARLPAWVIDWHVLRPMRWATRGTILAARAALECGLAVNLGGGYHHAKPEHGEGFSIYSDIGIAVAALRADGLLGESERVVYIDLDVHQGNGVCHVFRDDPRVFIFDQFNRDIYPSRDLEALQRIDCSVGLGSGCGDDEHLDAMHSQLPGFLDSVCRSPTGLAIYTAGTDVVEGDPLGNMALSAGAIRVRDCFVISQLRKRGIPAVMVTGGGYTAQSYQLVAESVIALLTNEEAPRGERG